MPFVPDTQEAVGRFVPDAPAAPPKPPVDRSRGAAAIPTAADEGLPASAGDLTLTNPQAIEAGARAERMRAKPPTLAQKLSGGVEAGLNTATMLLGGVLGMPIGTGVAVAEGVGLKDPTGPGGKPISQEAAMNEASAGIGGALKRAVVGEAPNSDVAAEYTENVGDAMGPLQAFVGPAAGAGAHLTGTQTAVTGVKRAVGDAARVRAAPAVAERVKAAKLEAPELKGVAEAHEAGFTLPPNKTKQGGATGAAAGGAESLSGGPTLEKGMSKKNAEVVAKLAREDVGLPADEPISRESVARVRKEAGKKYEVLKKIDTIDNDKQYHADLDKITESYDTAAESFPHRSENPFQKTIDGLRQDKMTGAAAVEEVKLLRADADKFYRQGDKGLGRAYKDAAKALDDSIDRHLTKMAEANGTPELATAVADYRAARKQIAKTYLLDSAMNETTGTVDAAKYVRALDKGTPLDGPGLTIAKAAKQFPKVFQKVDKIGNTGGPTALDAGLALLTKNKAGLALDAVTAGARPAARAVLASKPVQRMITKRARDASKEAEAKPPAAPPEPTTTPGAGGGDDGGTPPKPGPLGDLTPDWETTPGAGGGKPRGGEEPGLVRAVDEPEPTTGNRKSKLEIPAVPGRPDLPDALVTGGPAEVAATERANKAVNEPGAIEARRVQAEAAQRRERAAEPRVPVGEVKEGQPPIKPEKTGKVPVGTATEGQPEIKVKPAKPLKAGEATELPVERIEPKEPIPEGEVVPLTPEQDAAWRKEFGLGDGDAGRAKAVAAALKHDAEAVEKAAVQFDNQPRAFDREIARITEEGQARENEVKQAADSGEGPGAADAAKQDADTAAPAVGEQRGPDSPAAAAGGGEQAPAGGQAAAGAVEVREVPGGFEAYRDGKKVGYLKDNLERGQAKQLGENANVDMVKVDKDEQGKGTGRALYAAFESKHEGAIMPSGKTEPSAWKLWKRNYPEKVDAFVAQEAKRIADGGDPAIIARNITDPEIRQRVLQEAQDGKQLRPDDLRTAADEKGPKKGDAPEPPEEIFSVEKAKEQVADYKAGRVSGKPVGSPEKMREVLADKFGAKLVDGLIDQGLLKFALSLDEGRTTAAGQRGVKAVFRQRPDEPPSATLYFDRITPENAPALLMHELGEHFGAPRMLGTERYSLVMNELKALADSDAEVKAAWKHVEDNYIGPGTPDNVKRGDDTFMREVAAHLVETQPDLPWVRRLVNEVRAFFYEQFGTTMGNRVDANLIRGLAAAALRKASTGGLAGQRPTPRQFKPFVPSRTVMGSTEKRPPTQ